MTNFEYIKSMTAKEFFDFLVLTDLDTCRCPAKEICCNYYSCGECFIDWLNSEHNLKT